MRAVSEAPIKEMRFLLLNQTFHPDVMGSGQYLTEAAQGLVARGHEVTVVTGRRGYDDPREQFPSREQWRGIGIWRVSCSGLGKNARWRRVVDSLWFLLRCAIRVMVAPKQDVVVTLSSPPLISVVGAVAARLRGWRFVYWVMDLNPDEAISAGWLRAGSLAAKVFEAASRFSLRQADRIVALDRFMRARIVAKGIAREKVAVLPPWSLDEQVQYNAAGRDRFRKAHGLEGRFVVMHAGNHSPCHPLETLLEATRELAAEKDIVFCFVGGGSEWRKLAGGAVVWKGDARTEKGGEGLGEETEPRDRGRRPASNENLSPNFRLLAYQPLEELSGVLSAADLHVVLMGDGFVGVVHPCKIYNVLKVGAPVLYIGPRPSPVWELLARLDGEHAWYAAAHGEVAKSVEGIRAARAGWGSHARRTPAFWQAEFGRETVLPRLLRLLEGRDGACERGTRAESGKRSL